MYVLLALTFLSTANGAFPDFNCSVESHPKADITGAKCYSGNYFIQVGNNVNGSYRPLYWSCFDRSRLEVLYVKYKQNPENARFEPGGERPSWLGDNFFPGVIVYKTYSKPSQKNIIASFVGKALANKYFTNIQFLSRGHLAAKSDFILATDQCATFNYINVAPQWQPFNGGNWNSLEKNLRYRIKAAGYHTTIYTGTFGVTQLRNQQNRLVDIFLHRAANGAVKIPVPFYFYKVVYDASRRLGTAFVSINNPYYTEAEVRSLQFCTDRCRDNAAFNWIGWQPDRIDIGYSFCCTVDDFRRKIPHLPAFRVKGLLT